MHLEDVLAADDVRIGDHHLAIEAAGPQQRRIEHVGPIGRRDQNDAFVGFEAVHLDEQLVERLLALIVAAAEAGAAMAADGVDFVNEDDARRVFLGLLNMSRTRLAPTPTNISTKSEPEIVKNGTLASPATARAISVLPVPGGPTKQHAARNSSAEALELTRVAQEFDDFLEVLLASSTPATSSKVTRPCASVNSLARDLPKPSALPPAPCICHDRRSTPRSGR